MIDAERREKARLRSERWRRAHGIGPRRPAKQPWLAEGVSRSTWYRRKQRARQAAAVACACATFERAEAFAAALTRDLMTASAHQYIASRMEQAPRRSALGDGLARESPVSPVPISLTLRRAVHSATVGRNTSRRREILIRS
jgi:hypothetical protein